MTSIGSAQLLSSLTQLRSVSVSQSETRTTVAKALSEAQNITLDGSSTLLLRQNLSDTADLISMVEVNSAIIDGVATRLAALENLEIQQMQLSQIDDQHAALSVQINNAQNELTDYVAKNVKTTSEWKIVSDQSAGSDQYFDFQEWSNSVDTELSSRFATLQMKGEMLTANFHMPANCFICNSGNDVFAAAATTTSATLVGSISDTSTSTSIINLEALRSGSLWNISGSSNLSYSYFSGVPYADPYANRAGGPQGTITGLNSTQQADHDQIMSAWDDVVDFEFEKIAETNASNVGELRIAKTSFSPDQGVVGFAYYPNANPSGGDIWYVSSESSNDSFAAGTQGRLTALHEVGHAIGLKHPFQGGSQLLTNLDNARNTVMTYNGSDRNLIWNHTSSRSGISSRAEYVNPITPMLYDVAFAQENYGMETSVRNTNTSYTFTSAPEVLQTIVDGGGSDTIDVSALNRSSTINLTPGSFSSIGSYSIANQLAAAKSANPGFDSYLDRLYGSSYTANLYQWDDNVAIAYGTTIENAIGGSGADTITGNNINNEIWGKGGNDVINGVSGTDTAGYSGSYASYTISTSAGTTTVTHNNSGADGIDTLTNIDFLKFSDFTYDVAAQSTSATSSAGAPTGAGQNASSSTAAAASSATSAATGARVAEIVRTNTPASHVAITYTAAQQRSVNNGRMAAIAGLSGRLATLNTSLETTKSRAFHSLASISSPAAASARPASRMSIPVEASRQVNFAPMTSVQAPRVPITAMNDFVKSMNVTNSSLVAAIMRA